MKKIFVSVITFAFVFSMLSTPALSGTTWGVHKRLGGWSAGDSEYPDVAVWEDNVHVVWMDDPTAGGNPEIYYRRSRNGGTTWDPWKKRISWTTGISEEPAIAVYGDDVHVVWADNTPGHFEIYYRRSRDGGTTWDPKKRISWTSGGHAVNPDIASYYYNIGGTLYKLVHVVWEGGATPREIYYRRSANGGSTWAGRKRISWTSGDSAEPSIDAWTDLVAVTWQDEGTPGGSLKIFLRVCLSYTGTPWEPKRRVSYFSGDQHHPSVAIWGPHVHIVWWGTTTTWWVTKMWYKRNDNFGRPGSWTYAKRLDWTAQISALPSIDVHGIDNLHLVWTEWVTALGRYEIMYRSSDDGGDHWAPRNRITWTAGTSYGASIEAWGTVAAAELHVVWQDDTPTNWEIYYRKGGFVP